MCADEMQGRPSALNKIFRIGEFLFGCSGSIRMMQLLQYSLEIPQQQEGISDERYMVTVFIESVRDCLREGGFSRNESGEEFGGEFMVAYRDRVYEIYDDFQVSHWKDGLAAVGAGKYYALGAMSALSHLKPKAKITRALEVAAEFSPWCAPPFVVEKL